MTTDPRGTPPPPPPLGSVAVFHPPAVHCQPRRYHNKTTRRLLRLPSWLQKRKRLVKVQATCPCMTRFPTGETHHVRPVSSGGSLSRRWPLSPALSIEEGAYIRSNVVVTGGLATVGGRLCVSLTSCCNSFSTSGTSGFGARGSAVEITRRSKSSN